MTLLKLVDLFHKQCSVTFSRDTRCWHSNQWSITEESLLHPHWIHVRTSHLDIETHWRLLWHVHLDYRISLIVRECRFLRGHHWSLVHWNYHWDLLSIGRLHLHCLVEVSRLFIERLRLLTELWLKHLGLWNWRFWWRSGYYPIRVKLLLVCLQERLWVHLLRLREGRHRLLWVHVSGGTLRIHSILSLLLLIVWSSSLLAETSVERSSVGVVIVEEWLVSLDKVWHSITKDLVECLRRHLLQEHDQCHKDVQASHILRIHNVVSRDWLSLGLLLKNSLVLFKLSLVSDLFHVSCSYSLGLELGDEELISTFEEYGLGLQFGSRSSFSSGETHKAKSKRLSLEAMWLRFFLSFSSWWGRFSHDFDVSGLSELLEVLFEFVISRIQREVLHIEVELLHWLLVLLSNLLDLGLSLGLLEGLSHIQSILTVQVHECSLGILGVLEAHEAKA